MIDRLDVQRYIEERFPDCTVKSRMAIPYRNSRIYHLDLCREQSRERIVVKISRNYQPRQPQLSAPPGSCRVCQSQPLLPGPKLAMSHVPGVNLAYMLHEIRPVSLDALNRALDLSAAALAQYHRIFCHDGRRGIQIDRAAPEEDINRLLLMSRSIIPECNLQTMVTPFFDFTPWNIIIDDPEKKMMLYLIDFPRSDYVCTPHLDLARFLFSLELIKQFPPARFLKINRWNVEASFDRFLCGYCRKMKMQPNRHDLDLIALARQAYIRRACDLGRKGRCGWQPKIELAYLRAFSRPWLDQNGGSAQWPRPGWPDKA
ncbi:MAG: hypothetical protein LUQ30_02620 [Methanothrix sp.]|nr:hypothetical protein [Methanothrix sp.]